MCSLKDLQNFIQSFSRYKVWLFSKWSNDQIDIEYPQGIFSTISVVEDYSGLFAHSSIILIKDSMLA